MRHIKLFEDYHHKLDKKQVEYFIQKYKDKMPDHEAPEALGWVDGIGELSNGEKKAVWDGIQKYIKKSDKKPDLPAWAKGSAAQEMNESTPEYQAKLDKFLDHPWQEDKEIEFVGLVSEYRDKFKSAPDSATKSYLKSMNSQLTGAHMQLMSDEFMGQLDELIK